MRRQILAAAVVLGLVAGLFTSVGPVQASTGAKVYWTDADDLGTATSKVSRSNLDGSTVEPLVTPAAPNPRFIALDPAGGKMYWTDTGSIRRANLDGTGVEDSFIVDLPGPVGIALDAGAQHVYWTDSATSAIHRANLDGTGMTTILTVISPGKPRGLVLDAAGGKLYWTETGTRRVRRANLDGSAVEDLVFGAGLFPQGIALDAAGGKVYWADFGRIRRANLDGSGVEDVVAMPLANPIGIAVDAGGGKVYWTDTFGRTIQRANLDGSAVEDIVTGGLDTPWGIALFLPTVLSVGIDIKPGGVPNSINPAGHGTIPVAVLSTADFNAPAVVDPTSLTFGRTGAEASLAFCNGTPEDVNGDGLPDLMCHFSTEGTGFQAGDTQGILRGKTLDGRAFEGADSVRIIF